MLQSRAALFIFEAGAAKMFTGAIIKETISDEFVFDYVEIEKAEIWKTNDTIKYWTVVWFKSDAADFPERLSSVIIDGWFADMKEGTTKYIVFRDTVLKYTIGNAAEKNAVLDECRKRGIPDEQMGWEE